jgi:hypothetical protein
MGYAIASSIFGGWIVDSVRRERREGWAPRDE